jgi:hypothetical protein
MPSSTGWVKDEGNYVIARTGIKGQHGIDIRIDGKLTSACCSTALLESGDRWPYATGLRSNAGTR